MRPVILHAHLFKNAGSTIDWVLRNNFGSGFYVHSDTQAMKSGADYLSDFLTERPHVKALSSHHLQLPLREMPSIHPLKLIMLRHPIERVLSVYDFERKQRDSLSRGSQAASKYDIGDYIKWRMFESGTSVICDYHVRSLIGLRGVTELTDRHLEQARSYLQNDFLYGIVDEFDKSLQLMASRIREYFPDFKAHYERQNVARNKSLSMEEKLTKLQGTLGDELYAQLVNANAYDLALYAESKNKLLEAYETAGLAPEQLEVQVKWQFPSRARRFLHAKLQR